MTERLQLGDKQRVGVLVGYAERILHAFELTVQEGRIPQNLTKSIAVTNEQLRIKANDQKEVARLAAIQKDLAAHQILRALEAGWRFQRPLVKDDDKLAVERHYTEPTDPNFTSVKHLFADAERASSQAELYHRIGTLVIDTGLDFRFGNYDPDTSIAAYGGCRNITVESLPNKGPIARLTHEVWTARGKQPGTHFDGHGWKLGEYPFYDITIANGSRGMADRLDAFEIDLRTLNSRSS